MQVVKIADWQVQHTFRTALAQVRSRDAQDVAVKQILT